MAFVNEHVLDVDSTRYNLDQLYNKYNNENFTYSYNWIRDKETGTWLMPIKNLNNNETIWILHYKNTNIEIKLYRTKDNWDLISIAPNSLKNQEIIETLQNALKGIESSDEIWARPRKIDSKEKKEIKKELKKTSKKKISYLDILVGIVVFVVLFYVANDKNKISPAVVNNDNNKTTTKKQTIKSQYNVCAVQHDGIYLTNSENLNSKIKIIESTKQLQDCSVDKYGNLYWVSVGNEGLYKANIDGTNVRKIVSLPVIPNGLAIDNKNERIFSAQWNPQIKAHEIVYSNFSGDNKTILISDRNLLRAVGGMFYDYIYDKLYVTDPTKNQLVVIDLKTKELTELASSTDPLKIAIDYKNNKVIWSDRSENNIYNANLDGSNKKVLIHLENIDEHGYHNGGFTIDTQNNRLVYSYNFKDGKYQHVIETSNLDGTQRKKIKSKNLALESLSFFNNNFIVPKTETSEQNKIETQDKPQASLTLKSCTACHGKDWSKSALGKSAIVKNMSKENIERALKGYKSGTYGGPMKGLMKGQVARYSDKELEAMAVAIKSK